MSPRNSSFRPDREPFRDRAELRLQNSHVTGPFSFFNPTNARFRHDHAAQKDVSNEPTREASTSDDEKLASPVNIPATDVSFLWRSRDNRKGRHALLVKKVQPGEDAGYMTPDYTSTIKEIGRNILHMFTYFPFWDISWLVAIFFVVGSVVWVFNGFFVWLPVVDPNTEFYHEILYGGGITAFIGAIIFFETGSILLLFEAVNENSSGCFGWAVEQLVDGSEESKGVKIRVKPSSAHCTHHHQNKGNFVGKASRKLDDKVRPKDENTKDGKSWQWFPSWHALKTHYLHELGFLAGCSQFFGATIFGISGFTALPGIQDHLAPQRVLNGAYWIPQVIGGSGFIVSSTLYMLETQKHWYTPAFKVLGWHIGFWNLIGAIGFTLSGALGMAYGNSGAQFEAGLATFWGSWAFLIGSVLQWYESVDKNPVESLDEEK